MKPNLIKSFRIHPKRYICITSFLTILFLLLGLYFKYKDGEFYLQTQIDPIFQRIIDEELNSRFNKSGILISHIFSTKTKTGIIPKAYGYPEEQTKQQILYENHHELHPDLLAHRMKAFFTTHRTEVECIIYYTNLKTNKILKSHSSYSLSKMPFHSSPLILDTKCTIQTQCFLDFHFLTILNKGDWNIYFLFAILTGSLLLITINYSKKQKIVQNETEFTETHKSEIIPQLLQFETIILNPISGELKTSSKKIYLTKYLTLLLILFIEAPEEFIKDKEIMHNLWGITGTKNKLNNLVSRLRKELHNLDPYMDIKKYSNRGYRIIYEKTANETEQKNSKTENNKKGSILKDK